jgi:hypothetical protein
LQCNTVIPLSKKIIIADRDMLNSAHYCPGVHFPFKIRSYTSLEFAFVLLFFITVPARSGKNWKEANKTYLTFPKNVS